MNYKKLIELLKTISEGEFPMVEDWVVIIRKKYLKDAVTAITDLIARAESAESRAEKAESERNAAIKMLRKIEWCDGCKNFRGLQGCRIGALVTCNPQNDMYVFGEGEE